MRRALLVAIGLAGLTLGAPARGQDNPACAQYQEPLAYNACLARLGPRAQESRAVAARSAHGGEISRGRRGRMRLEFDVGGKSRQP
ncbi:MAG: hypothetical protein ABSC22_09730 [Roseiarcus sp.]|jgi:hypothetical protein